MSPVFVRQYGSDREYTNQEVVSLLLFGFRLIDSSCDLQSMFVYKYFHFMSKQFCPLVDSWLSEIFQFLCPAIQQSPVTGGLKTEKLVANPKDSLLQVSFCK